MVISNQTPFPMVIIRKYFTTAIKRCRNEQKKKKTQTFESLYGIFTNDRVGDRVMVVPAIRRFTTKTVTINDDDVFKWISLFQANFLVNKKEKSFENENERTKRKTYNNNEHPWDDQAVGRPSLSTALTIFINIIKLILK